MAVVGAAASATAIVAAGALEAAAVLAAAVAVAAAGAEAVAAAADVYAATAAAARGAPYGESISLWAVRIAGVVSLSPCTRGQLYQQRCVRHFMVTSLWFHVSSMRLLVSFFVVVG